MLGRVSQKQADDGKGLEFNAPLHHFIAGLVVFGFAAAHGQQPAKEGEHDADHGDESASHKYFIHEPVPFGCGV
jgi:hypothetical protein